MPVKFDTHKVELNWGGQPLTLETGKIARQADGAVLATLGETVVLATVVSAHSAKPVVALVWHAHLSMRTAFKLQTHVMRLPGHELLPARGGVNFPLSKEEMRWHLDYFGITV